LRFVSSKAPHGFGEIPKAFGWTVALSPHHFANDRQDFIESKAEVFAPTFDLLHFPSIADDATSRGDTGFVVTGCNQNFLARR
jgi:hypothetical protein